MTNNQELWKLTFYKVLFNNQNFKWLYLFEIVEFNRQLREQTFSFVFIIVWLFLTFVVNFY